MQRRSQSKTRGGSVAGAAAAGVGEVVDGVGASVVDLPPARSSVERSQRPITTEATTADPIMGTRIMPTPGTRLRATTPNHMRAVAVAAEWNTACNDTGATIQIPGPIRATMAVPIRVRRSVAAKQKPRLDAGVFFSTPHDFHSQNLHGGKSRL